MENIHGMNIQSIDLNLLVALEALLEERHVTRAAKRIGLSQPAMSNALNRLRQTFNDPLLVRAATGMEPTPLAQTLLVPVRSALAQLREVFEEGQGFDPSVSERTFHLLANDYAEIVWLPAVLRKLRRTARSIHLRVQRPAAIFEPPSVADLATSFDLAIGFYPDALALDRRLHSHLLWEDRNVCLAAASHPVIRGKISLKQYTAADHAALFYQSAGPGLIDTLLAQQGMTRRIACRVPHFTSLPYLVSRTDLIATAPERLARMFKNELKLQVLPVPLKLPPFRLTLLWHERHLTEPAHRWLRKLMTG